MRLLVWIHYHHGRYVELNGENGKDGIRGVSYGESSPCFRNSTSWFGYIEPLKSSFRIH